MGVKRGVRSRHLLGTTLPVPHRHPSAQVLSAIDAPLAERQAMMHGHEPVEVIWARLPVETLADERIPIILEDPIVPVV